MDEAVDASAAMEGREDAGPGAAGKVRLWLAAIEAAGREERDWRDDAAHAMKVYTGRRSEAEKTKSRFNILYANADTLVPAIYNTPPIPDVRRRYGDADPVGAYAARVLERGLSLGLDEYDFHGEMEAIAYDAYLAGRGVSRVRYEPYIDGDVVAYEAVRCQHVPWDCFRRGPARRWEECGWVAFYHELTRDELRRMAPRVADKVSLDAKDKNADDEDHESGEIFGRAVVWEVWDRETRTVLFISPGYREAPLKEVEDPLGLEGFFPCPEPVTFICRPGSLTPICPFNLYKDQAEELDRLTQRISAIVRVLRWRGVYLDQGQGSALSDLEQADDGKLVPLAGMPDMKLDDAIWLMPIDRAIAVVVQLVEQREQVKATIYEITGISDILRGSSTASETATAQGIKAQWGSLRISRMQTAMANHARNLLRLKAEIIAEKFSPQTLSLYMGEMIPPEVVALLREQRVRPFRIDVETDSTIRADLGRQQGEFASFVSGLGALIQGAAPVVQAEPAMRPVLMALIKSGSRMFRLGREVEEAMESIPNEAPPQADPNAAAQAQAQAEMQAEQMRIQAETQTKQMQIEAGAQAKQAEMQMRMQVEGGKLALQAQIAQAQLELERLLAMERMDREDERHAAALDVERARPAGNA